MKDNALEGWAVMARAVELVREGESFVLATVVWRQGPSSGQSGARAIVTESGQLFGWIGGACAEPVLIREAKKVLQSGKPQLIWLGQEAEFVGMHIPDGVMTVPIACQSDGALQIYIEPMMSVPELVVVGRSPMAFTLVELAKTLDWNATLVDANDFESDSLSDHSIVVIATQGHGDEEAVEIALQSSPAYLGVVASKKRGSTIHSYLLDRGVSAAKIESVRIPIGIDLGHTTHREVSVSILAELVSLRAAGKLKGTRARLELPLLNEPLLNEMAEEVTDLVCGMTIKAEKSNRPFEYEGDTYYFCAPGCRISFEKNPTQYLVREMK